MISTTAAEKSQIHERNVFAEVTSRLGSLEGSNCHQDSLVQAGANDVVHTSWLQFQRYPTPWWIFLYGTGVL